MPTALFVSGHCAPHVPRSEPPTFDLSDDELIGELRRLSGTPREVLDDADALKLFLPTIRADLELIETYAYQPEAPFACAIYAYGGLQDASVPLEFLHAWQKQTSAKLATRLFPGGHFFIQTATATLLHALCHDVRSELLPTPPPC
jgi:medium-chain acyl-[acyl-carrier-protein] hydrolase